MELIQEIVPPGVINIVNGPGAEIGKALATNKRIARSRSPARPSPDG